ncbi:MAG: type II secretion system secretin GspD [Ottowia sp.]
MFDPISPRTALSLALASWLAAACVTQAPAQPVAEPPASETSAAQTVEAPQEPAAAPAAESSDQAQPPEREPLIVRGNDEMVRAPKNLPRVTGPVSAFKFEDAPVGEVVHVMLRDLLKVDYVIHPPLNGRVTLVTRGQVSADKAMNLLESALQLNGIVMARDARGTYHVGAPSALRDIVSAPRIAGDDPLPPGYGAIIIPLEYLGAAEMANILRALAPSDAIVRVDTLRNILIMRGTRAEAEGWLDVVKTFDVNLLRGMSVGVFPLQYTSPAEVQHALSILSGAAGSAAAAVAPVPVPVPGRGAAAPAQATPAPAPLGENNPLFGAVRVMPLDSINSVLVITPRAAYLDEIKYWINKFDRPNAGSSEPQLFVYKVKNGSSEHLAELLNGIYGGAASESTSGASSTGVAPGLSSVSGGTAGASRSPFGSSLGSFSGGSSGSVFSGTSSSANLGGGGLFGNRTSANQGNAAQNAAATVTVTLGQNVRVMADRINNTLLIYATPGEFSRIEATLKRLDVQRAQVLIEASIIEVTLGDDLQYGLQWAFKNNDGEFGTGRNGLGVLNNGRGTTIGGASLGSTIRNAAQGFSYTLTSSIGNLTAVLNTLASKSLLKVISSPSLMVLDNHTAAISVGDQQPVNTGTTISSSGTIATTNNIQYKDTGVMLNVTPSVNAGDLVTMEIEQTITDIGRQDDVTGQRSFMQRQIASKVAVRSGETLVLGGLIKNNQSQGSSGLPLLSSIPVLGGLFGSQNKSDSRTELLVVITPRVLRSDEDARAVSREMRDRMRGLSLGDASLPHP